MSVDIELSIETIAELDYIIEYIIDSFDGDIGWPINRIVMVTSMIDNAYQSIRGDEMT